MILNEKSSLQKLFVKQFQALWPDIKQHKKKNLKAVTFRSNSSELCIMGGFRGGFSIQTFFPHFFFLFFSVNRSRALMIRVCRWRFAGVEIEWEHSAQKLYNLYRLCWSQSMGGNKQTTLFSAITLLLCCEWFWMVKNIVFNILLVQLLIPPTCGWELHKTIVNTWGQLFDPLRTGQQGSQNWLIKHWSGRPSGRQN